MSLGLFWRAFSMTVISSKNVVQVRPCEVPGHGRLLSLTVSPCNSDPCQLLKGGNTTFTFSYVFDQDSDNVTVVATIDVLGMEVPVPHLEPDLCLEALKCPVVKNVKYDGSISMLISHMPVTQSQVEVKVIGDKGLSACFKFPVILEPRDSRWYLKNLPHPEDATPSSDQKNVL